MHTDGNSLLYLFFGYVAVLGVFKYFSIVQSKAALYDQLMESRQLINLPSMKDLAEAYYAKVYKHEMRGLIESFLALQVEVFGRGQRFLLRFLKFRRI